MARRVDVQRKTSFAAPPAAPSFAVRPLWQSGGLRKCQKPLQNASKPARAASKTRCNSHNPLWNLVCLPPTALTSSSTGRSRAHKFPPRNSVLC